MFRGSSCAPPKVALAQPLHRPQMTFHPSRSWRSCGLPVLKILPGLRNVDPAAAGPWWVVFPVRVCAAALAIRACSAIASPWGGANVAAVMPHPSGSADWRRRNSCHQAKRDIVFRLTGDLPLALMK